MQVFESLPKEYSKEGLYFEAKSAPDGVPSDFWETYSAFANTFGGKIVFGLSEDDDGNLHVTGVDDVERTISILWDNLNNPRFTNHNLLKNDDVKVVEVSGKELIEVTVPAADRRRRPIYIRNSLNSGTFKRNHEGDYHCRMDEIKEMIRDSQDTPLDVCPIESLGMECFDDGTIDRYLGELVAHRPGHPWVRIPREDFLVQCGAMAEVGTNLYPTAAGLLMFGKVHCIRRIFSNYFLDYRESIGSERWSYRIHSNSGDWSGNVYDFVSEVMTRLSLKIGSRFVMEGYVNTGGSDTYISVREAVINGVIHADYHLSRGVVVEYNISDVTVTNPGTMRVRIDDAIKGGHSDPRNCTMMSMAMAIGWVERIGSGIYMMERAKANGHLSRISISESSDPSMVKVMLRFPVASEERFEEANDILDLIRLNPSITKRSMAMELGISESKVSQIIDQLRSSGKVVREGSRKAGRWTIRD